MQIENSLLFQNNFLVKIRSHSATVVDLALREPMRLPFGEVSSRPSAVVHIDLVVDGHTESGFGEGATLDKPLFTDDSGENIGRNVNELLQFLGGSPVPLSQMLMQIQRMDFGKNARFPTARMTVEMALIDAYSKVLKLPAIAVMGLSDIPVEVSYGKSLGASKTDDILRQAYDSLGNGSKKIKLKVTPDTFDQVVAAIIELKRSSNCSLMVDANGTFDPNDHVHMGQLEKLDELGLVMIEEPVSRVGSVRGVEAVYQMRKNYNFSTPICLDDCLKDFETSLAVIDLGYANVVNIKPGRIGSIIKAVELAQYCLRHNAQIMVGGMLEATPGRCMTVGLAAIFSSMGFKIPGDLSLPQERLADDLVSEDQLMKYSNNGGIKVPQGNGWGFTVDWT